MEAKTALVQNQLCGSGAAFSVKYIGLIEVATPFHDVKTMGEKRVALCNGCASLIAHAAGLISNIQIEPEIQELIGSSPPKVINKDIDLTITNKLITLFSSRERKLLKRVEIENISVAVTVGDAVENGFIFIGKVTIKNELKRFCFLLKSDENPTNIYSTINVAFTMCDQASNHNSTTATNNNTNRINGGPSADDILFKKPYPPERAAPALPDKGVLSYINVGEKIGDPTPLFNQKIGKPRPYLDADIKSYPGPFPDVTHIAKVYKTAEGGRLLRQPEIRKKEAEITSDITLGDLLRFDPERTSIYSNVFTDDLANDIFSNEEQPFTDACTVERFQKICSGLEKQPWYFGKIHRDSVDNYLKQDGSFLVRISETRPRTAILSVRQGHKVNHLLLNDEYGNVKSLGKNFGSVIHLIAFHARNKVAFTSEGNDGIEVYIKHPTHHPKFQKL